MKRSIFLLAFLFFLSTGFSQKIISDATISYNVLVTSGKEEPGLADAFDGASYTVFMKGPLVRTDFKSILRTQTLFYNAADSSVMQLRESGKDKYLTNFDKNDWEKYNKKYANSKIDLTTETKKIAGHECKKAIITLANNGGSVIVYYSSALTLQSPGYDYLFKDVPGIPLEYEVTTGKVGVKYLASAVILSPVSTAKFEKPKEGYKLLEYKN